MTPRNPLNGPTGIMVRTGCTTVPRDRSANARSMASTSVAGSRSAATRASSNEITRAILKKKKPTHGRRRSAERCASRRAEAAAARQQPLLLCGRSEEKVAPVGERDSMPVRGRRPVLRLVALDDDFEADGEIGLAKTPPNQRIRSARLHCPRDDLPVLRDVHVEPAVRVRPL